MNRINSLSSACVLALFVGLLSATSAYAQQNGGANFSGSDLSPAKSNCGPNNQTCANYSTGDVTANNPSAHAPAPNSPIGAGGDLSPAKSNCGPDMSTCANYSTGNVTANNPAQKPATPQQKQ